MKKGLKSKIQILEACLNTFNEKGNEITMNNLAKEIGVSRGRINHFFPTRDSLFLALADIYESRFLDIQMIYNLNLENYQNKLEAVIKFYEDVMDLQFDYRCCIIYIISQLNSKNVNVHTQKTYNKARELSLGRLKILVDAGFIKPELLKNENFEPFFFQVSNLLTNWLIQYYLYEPYKNLSEAKKKYLSGIMRLYNFYLTEAGLEFYTSTMDAKGLSV